MRELRRQGRGGQGTILASRPPAWALFREDKDVRSLPAPGGERCRFTVGPPGEPVDAESTMQGRVRHLRGEAVTGIQGQVDRRWMVLEKRVEHET